MRCTSLSVSLILLLAGIAQAQTEATFPAGPLPGTVKPKTYRLSLTVDPAQKEFTGHTEIDAVLTQPARSIFLHGSELRVSAANVQSKLGTIAANYTELQSSGVVRLDFAKELARGRHHAHIRLQGELSHRRGRSVPCGGGRPLVRVDPDGAHRRKAHVSGLRRTWLQDTIHRHGHCAQRPEGLRERAARRSDAGGRHDHASIRHHGAAAYLPGGARRRCVRCRRNERSGELDTQAAACHAHHLRPAARPRACSSRRVKRRSSWSSPRNM